jgi:hypothetical protein
MKDLMRLITYWFVVKTAKNPSPDLEKKIEDKQRELQDQISLLRLSNSELMNASKEYRFEVMEDLINDIARYKGK